MEAFSAVFTTTSIVEFFEKSCQFSVLIAWWVSFGFKNSYGFGTGVVDGGKWEKLCRR